MKGKFSKKDGRIEKKKGEGQQKSYDGDTPAVRCYHCKNKGHTRKVFPKHLNNLRGKDNGNITNVQGYYESSNVLVVSSSNSSKEWIMDSWST